MSSHWGIKLALEKCSLSHEKDMDTVPVSTLRAKIEVCTRGCGGKESRKLEWQSPPGKLLLIQTASVWPVNLCLLKRQLSGFLIVLSVWNLVF